MARSRGVTIADIARRVGLTNITVSRALNRPEMVKPATRARIRSAASELGYVPNAFARGLKRSESRLIGIVTASVDNPFYGEMIKSISRHAKQHDYAVLLFDTDGEPWLERTAIETLLSYQAAGIILSPVSDEPHYAPSYLAQLETSGTPVVQLDRRLCRSAFSAVVLDNAWAGECAAAYLLENAFRDSASKDSVDNPLQRLLVVAGPEYSSISRDRLAGVRDSLARTDRDIVVDVLWGDYNFEPAFDQVGNYLDHYGRPRAIFGLNQLITLGALKALKTRGIDWAELDVVGIDRLPYLDIFGISVPCVVHDGYRTGEQALTLLLEHIEDPSCALSTITIRGELIE